MNVDWAVEALARYGLPGIFVVVALEYACLPMPSELLLPLAGLSAAATGAPLALAVAVSVAAGLVGSALCYGLGFLGGMPFLEKLFARFPKACERLAHTQRWESGVGGLSVMVARVIPIVRTWISFAAGLVRQPFCSFLLYSAMGILVWNSVLLSGGYYLYAAGAALGKPWLLPVLGMALLLLAYLVRKLAARRKRA